MGETDVHTDALIYLREALRDHFRDALQIYVAGNIFLYYEEGNPMACVAPDVFVVQGVGKHERRTYRLWEEGQPSAVVFAITSRGHPAGRPGHQAGSVRHVGAGGAGVLRVRSAGEYLRPPLQGYRLHEGEYQRMPPAGVEG